LLVYIYATGIKEGPLFPNHAKLSEIGMEESRFDGIVKQDEVIGYETYQNRYKHLCNTIINRESRFGSHSNRKTGYLLAVWGGGHIEAIMSSARHKTLKNAQKYKRDAEYMLHVARGNDLDIDSILPKWRPVLVEDVQMGRGLNLTLAQNMRPLLNLSTKYLEEVVKIPLGSSLIQILQMALSFKNPSRPETLFVTRSKPYRLMFKT